MFPSRCFCLESTDVKPPNHRSNPKPLGWNKLKWKFMIFRTKIWEGGGGQWTLKFSLRPSSQKSRGSGVKNALTHGATVQCVTRLFRVWWVNSRVELCYAKFCGGCHLFFLAGWRIPYDLISRFHSKKPIQLFNSPVVHKFPQDEWVICVRFPSPNSWPLKMQVEEWAVTLVARLTIFPDTKWTKGRSQGESTRYLIVIPAGCGWKKSGKPPVANQLRLVVYPHYLLIHPRWLLFGISEPINSMIRKIFRNCIHIWVFS